MFSIITFLIPLLCIVLGPVLMRLAYRRADDGGPAKVPRFLRTAWALPMIPALLTGLTGIVMAFADGPTNGMMWGMVFIDLMVPVAFLQAYLATRDNGDRTVFFVTMTIWGALCGIAAALPAFATTYLTYLRSPWTRTAMGLVGAFPIAAFAFALYERKGVAARAFKRIGVDISGEAPSPSAGAGFRKVWFLPMVLPVLLGVLIMVLMGATGVMDSVITAQVTVDLLVPLAFLLGYRATRTRRERVALLVSTAVWVALLAAAIILSRTLPYYQYSRAPQATIMALVLCFYPIASLMYALWRRKDVIDAAQRRIDGVGVSGAQRKASRRIDAGASVTTGVTSQRSDASGAATRALFESALGVGPDVTSGAEDLSDQVREEAEGVEQRHAIATQAEQVAAAVPAVATAASVTTAIAAAGVPEVATTATASTATASAVAASANVAQASGTVIDVNKCSEMDLLVLPGMTVSAARAAVEERDAHGAYVSVEDFVRRNSLKPHLVVMFIDNLTCTRPSSRSGGGRRARTLDL